MCFPLFRKLQINIGKMALDGRLIKLSIWVGFIFPLLRRHVKLFHSIHKIADTCTCKSMTDIKHSSTGKCSHMVTRHDAVATEARARTTDVADKKVPIKPAIGGHRRGVCTDKETRCDVCRSQNAVDQCPKGPSVVL